MITNWSAKIQIVHHDLGTIDVIGNSVNSRAISSLSVCGRLGDLYMSLIHTCELCGASPFDYLLTLEKNADAVAAHPEHWLPWNYQNAPAGTRV